MVEDDGPSIQSLEHDEDGLAKQCLEKLVLSEINSQTPEVISRQATINIGTIGHVAHGKSTVVKALSGRSTVKFKQEKERNITIRLGYANCKIYKCDDPSVPAPQCYTSFPSDTPDVFPCELGGNWVLQRHVSFVDCPGHDILMATMLNGAAVMDSAFLLVAANESCPQPQTNEHLAAMQIMKLQNIVILQNKCELVKRGVCLAQSQAIKKFTKDTVAEDSPIIPISAVLQYNINMLCEYLCTKIPTPPRDVTSPPQMMIIRSFDVNKPGISIKELRGGVCGGSLLRGILKINQEVEIRPGIVKKNFTTGSWSYTPIRTRITSLAAETNELQFAIPGGLIGVGTQMDSSLTKSDSLVGNLLGVPGSLPPVYLNLQIKFSLLRKILGVKSDDNRDKKQKVSKLKADEMIMLNIGSSSVGAKTLTADSESNMMSVLLTKPICCTIGDKVSISRKIEKRFRLIGHGSIADAEEMISQ